MSIKIMNITNPKEFFEKVQSCKGQVFLKTDGNQLNLKSKLTQYLVLMEIFDKVEIKEMDLEVEEPKDMGLILDYLVRG